MSRKISPEKSIRQPLSDVLALIRSGERTPLSLTAFIQLASDLIKSLANRLQEDKAFSLFATGIKV